MKVELLVTGDELLSGAVADTNSAWLLDHLAGFGIRPSRLVMVGDEEERLVTALREASSRSDVVIVSGGLGPTRDDLTVSVAATVAGVGLVTHEPTLARMLERWRTRGKQAPKSAGKQALIPDGADVLHNEVGTAPGFRLHIGQAECWFFAGVPREFRHLCTTHLFPALAVRSDRVLHRVTLRCVGIAESEVDEALAQLPERFGVQLGMRAVFPETHVTMTVESPSQSMAPSPAISPPASSGASSESSSETSPELVPSMASSPSEETGAGRGAMEAAKSALAAAQTEALRLLGDRCYGVGDASLPEVVGTLCKEAGATIAVAESCTGGMLGAAITDIPGSSAWFVGGALVYANEEKTRALGVSESMLKAHGAVSEVVVRAMAEGIRQRTGATHALAITGVAGPGGGTPEKPVGTVWIGLASADSTSSPNTSVVTRAVHHAFPWQSRELIREASVSRALDLLRRTLLNETRR